MAQTQVKPSGSGSFTNFTTKTTTGMPDKLGNAAALHLALLAANEYTFTAGVASQRRTWATKHGTAAGIALQWA